MSVAHSSKLPPARLRLDGQRSLEPPCGGNGTTIGADGARAAISDAERLRQLELEVSQLQDALAAQRQIGAVIGLFAQRFGCSTDQAWSMVVGVSQHTNVKVRVVARVFVEAFNGRIDDADIALLDTLAARLPAPGWPRTSRTAGNSDRR